MSVDQFSQHDYIIPVQDIVMKPYCIGKLNEGQVWWYWCSCQCESIGPTLVFFQTSFYWEIRLFFPHKNCNRWIHSCATGTSLSMGLTSQRDSKLSHPQANRHVSVKLKIFLCIYSMKILHEKVKATQQDSQRGDVYKLGNSFHASAGQ